MTYKLAFLSTAFLMICASCTKHTNEPLTSSVQPLEGVDSVITALGNPQNPYDSIGRDHVGALASIMPNIYSGALVPSWTAEPNYGDSLLQSDFRFPSNFVSSFKSAFNKSYDSAIATYDFGTLVDSLGNAGVLSVSIVSFLDSLNDYFNDLAADSVTPTPSEYNTFANHVIELEHKIKLNLMLSQSDSIIVWACTSTARYSTAFWMNQHNNATTGIHIPHWLKVAIIDAGGALAGAAAGVGIAAPTGIGAGVAAIAGGIIGGVSASVAAGGKNNNPPQ